MATSAKPLHTTLRTRLEAVVREYYNPLRVFFRKRTRNSSEVDDLVQQVFMRLSRHLDKDAVKNPDAYIFRTASNTLRDFRRRELVRSRVISQGLDQITETDEIDADFSPERVLSGKEAMESVAGTLRQLPERTQDVFMLRCFEGLKIMEIARLQNMSVRSVENHLARALEALNYDMEQRNGRS